MRQLLTVIFLLFFITIFAQPASYTAWQTEAKDNKRMLPEYGNLTKTAGELEADQKFISNIVSTGKTKVEGAHEMIRLGFDYLYNGDLKTAMYRFNQAYLLQPKNWEIYWGYGAVYTALGDYDLARKQYDTGLKLNPENAPILTDYGTTYLGEYYSNVRTDYKLATKHLNKAKEKLLEAYAFDPEYINATYKLSIIYLYSQDCEQAKRFLKETRALGGQPITKEYLSDFNLRCGNCSSVKTGKFEIESSRDGITKITRTKDYQIEENESLGYKLKLKIEWLDDCTYNLTPLENLSNSSDKKLPNMVLNCQIIEVNSDSYIQISTAEGEKTQMTSKLNIVQ